MSQIAELIARLKQSQYERVEVVVSDMGGVPRGKLLPLADFDGHSARLPLAIFHQTITGDYYEAPDNVDDRDMGLTVDPTTMRVVPWAKTKTACVIADCHELTGEVVEANPRQVLKRVLERYADRGWHPVVAPEVEFYLMGEKGAAAAAGPGTGPAPDPYGLDEVHELGHFFEQLNAQCDAQEIALGAVSQELGPGQFEVNFKHGNPVRLADDLCSFKRTLKALAREHGMRATFLSKLDAEIAGSSLHLHQSVVDDDGGNVFSGADGEATEHFQHFVGGLQHYLADALLLFAPYANSYRRYLSYFSSPMNLEWGVDNRTAGLRVPRSDPAARRVENRIAGSDVNPYLAIAGSLACGWLGIERGINCRPAEQGSAYKHPFALRRHIYEAIDALRASEELADLLGKSFVATYTGVKETECREFQEKVPEWERNDLIHSV
ncbi:MAG: glutamine synthetase family protein [Pseudomonadota bacterium]